MSRTRDAWASERESELLLISMFGEETIEPCKSVSWPMTRYRWRHGALDSLLASYATTP